MCVRVCVCVVPRVGGPIAAQAEEAATGYGYVNAPSTAAC